MRLNRSRGFTLIEFVLATLTLVVAATAILGAYVGQVTLNEHARNLSLAIQDASRVIEQLRVNNTATPGGAACVGVVGSTAVFPTAVPSGGFTSWDAWLNVQPGGRSLQSQFERVVVTCQDTTTGTPNQCRQTGANNVQVGTGESNVHSTLAGGPYDPIKVTVAVCWRHRNRNIGQCSGTGPLTPDDSVSFPNNTPNVIESPAMLTTIITCRSQ